MKKKKNEIQLTKNKMDLNIRKMANRPSSPEYNRNEYNHHEYNRNECNRHEYNRNECNRN